MDCANCENGATLRNKPSCGCFGVRHVQILMLFVAMLLAYMSKVNMSLAIVDMTDPGKEDHFQWNHSEQSIVLSSFFWIYAVIQIPAGELARKFGGKILIAIAIFANSLFSVILPSAASLGDWKSVCACRILQGLNQGLIYPSTHRLISQWIPDEEKGTLSTILYAGSQLGTAIQLATSGVIISTCSWKGIFYINGFLGFIWTVLYLIFGAESPERSKWISKSELQAVRRSLRTRGDEKNYRTPWKKMFTSLPVIAIVVAHSGQNWGYYTLMTEMPTYMSKILHVDLNQNAILSSVPYVVMFFLSFAMGALTDLIIRKKWLSVTATRKLFNTIGFWSPAAALIGLSYCAEGNWVLAVVLLMLTLGLNSAQFVGYLLVHIDMAPNYSSTLMGVTNCSANIMSLIAPLVCGFLIKNEKDPSEWRLVFFMASGILFF